MAAGIADAADQFGITPRLDTACSVPVHLTVGARGTALLRGSPHATRVEVTTKLHEHLSDLGAAATLEIVPGIGHDGFALLPPATRFLSGLLHCRRLAAGRA